MKAHDQIPFVTPRETVQAAYGALSALQDERPGVQVMSAAVLFKVIADELRLDISELLNKAARITSDDDNPYRTEVAAFREYIRGELT